VGARPAGIAQIVAKREGFTYKPLLREELGEGDRQTWPVKPTPKAKAKGTADHIKNAIDELIEINAILGEKG